MTPTTIEERRDAVEPEERTGVRAAIEDFRGRLELGTLSPVIFFVLMIIVFGAAEPDVFLTTGNLTSIINDGAILAMIACGLTVVLAAGEYDLSIGAAASFGGALAAVLVAKSGWPVAAVVAAVLVSGLVIGMVNGVLITYFEINALVVTIAVSSILDGLTQLITGNSVIFEGFTDSFVSAGDWRIANLQAPVFYFAALAIVLALMLRYTATGRQIYAVGGNREASRMAGILVERRLILAFVISAVLASLAGFVYTARQASLTPLFGAGFLLPAFAAAYLGSVTLGRTFNVFGTVIGVYLITTGTTGLLIVGGPTYSQQVFAGVVLILATIGARYRKGIGDRRGWPRLRRGGKTDLVQPSDS